MKEVSEMSYGELFTQITEASEILRRKAFEEGYEKGFSDAELECPSELTEVTSNWKSQDERDRIVERAKEDVEKLKNARGHYEVGFKVCNAEFIVNKNKRTIVCLLRGYETNDVLFKGIAKCAPGDCFNLALGKAIALRRALGLEVPDEYLNAPQPSEVRVGDVIKMKYAGFDEDEDDDSMYYTRIVKEFDGERVRYEGHGWDFNETVDEKAEILDDSRDG